MNDMTTKLSGAAKALAAGVFVLLLCALTTAAQTPQTQDEKLEAANEAFKEGFEAFQKGTSVSLRTAVSKLETASELFKQAGDKRWQSAALLGLGRVLNDLGEKASAVERYKEALPLLRELKEKTGEIAALNNIAAAYLTLGENQLALKYFEESLPLIHSEGDRDLEAMVLSNVGVVYGMLGDQPTAIKYYEQALPLIEATNNKPQKAKTLANLGSSYTLSGDNRAALPYYERALPVIREIGDKRLEAVVLNNTGKIYSDLNESRKALEYYEQALPLRREVGDREGEAVTLNNIGAEQLILGDGRAALENCSRALLLRRLTGDLAGEAVTLNNIMGSWRVLGNQHFAVFFGKQAVNAYQKLRSNLRELNVGLQRAYLQSVEDTYRHLATILFREGRLSEAHQTLNSFKDQQFFDFASGQQKQSTPLALTPREAALAAEYERAIGRVGATGDRLEGLRRRVGDRQPNADERTQFAQLEADLKNASDDFTALLDRAAADFSGPRSDKDMVTEITDMRETQATLRELSSQTGQRAVAVHQFIGEDEFYLLLITSDDIKSVSTKVNKDDLQNRALQFWALLQSDKYDPARAGRDLYNVVFAPLENDLPKDTKTILWALDGNLRYVPMAALYDGRQYLVERYQNVVFTRADRERMTRPVKPLWTATGMGGSAAQTVEISGDRIQFGALPGVGEELRLLVRRKDSPRGIFEGEALQDAQFTRATMLSALERRRPLVHIASHFSFRPGDETRSFLLLGDGTAFTLAEMKQQENLFGGVELLVLSACNTAAQRQDASGREIDAFAELAQRLGADSVMATLWAVADNSTPMLMREFYRNRQGGTLNKAEALRQAQLALLHGTAETRLTPIGREGPGAVKVVVAARDRRVRDHTRADVVYVDSVNAAPFYKDTRKPFAHPYFWSPFILIGNWK
jgi:CHAT domain-containing protein/predicted negative regulator of RcsB-dependent stress response